MTAEPRRPSVLVLHDRPEDFQDLLAERFPGLPIHYVTKPEDVEPGLEGARPQVVFSIKQPAFPDHAHRPIMTFPSVEWVQVGGSGYEHLEPWDAARLTVTNCLGILAPFLAETVTGAMLMWNAGFPRYLRQQRDAVWQGHPFRPISDQTLLVVGLGAIGGCVASNAKALGMRVLGIRRTETPHPSVDALYPPSALPGVLGGVDVVSLHVRVSEETRHMINEDTLAAMKPGAFLINTARGAVVDEDALIAALEAGQLGGAYLDVFEVEPLPPESPLWRMENVLLTPHASDMVADWPRRFAAFFADNLDRWMAGEPLENLVTA